MVGGAAAAGCGRAGFRQCDVTRVIQATMAEGRQRGGVAEGKLEWWGLSLDGGESARASWWGPSERKEGRMAVISATGTRKRILATLPALSAARFATQHQ